MRGIFSRGYAVYLCDALLIEMIGGGSVELWKTEGLWITTMGLDIVCGVCCFPLMVQQTQNGQSIVGGQLV